MLVEWGYVSRSLVDTFSARSHVANGVSFLDRSLVVLV